MKRYRKLIIILLALFIGTLIQSCSSSDKSDIKTDDPDRAFAIAKRNYDKKDYLEAIDDFSLIKIKFSGTKIIDKSQFYLGMCYYQREEYILAAYEFEYLLKNYATSSFIVQDRYQLAMCYYNLSPKYDLDQTYTHYAINEFQNFLELYPTDKLATDAEARIKELKNKLAFKEFKTGDLYSKMGNYKAAIYYYELVLQDYFDSDYADNALYSKIQMLILRKNYSDARIEIERFERKFPKSNFLSKVSKLKENLPS